MSLEVGANAPEFTLPSDTETAVSLHDFRGKKVILYFYPKDNTPGCTQQACDFRDAFPTLLTQDCVIIGISKDSPSRHQKFKTKYNLPFTLLADETSAVCKTYDVIRQKNMFGRTVQGIQRSTFLIDEHGVIRAIWRNVKVPGHIEQVLHETR